MRISDWSSDVCSSDRPCRPRSGSPSFPVPLSDGGSISGGVGRAKYGTSSRLKPLLLFDEGAFEHVLAGHADAGGCGQAAGVEEAAEVGQALCATADQGARVSGVARGACGGGGERASVEAGGRRRAEGRRVGKG